MLLSTQLTGQFESRHVRLVGGYKKRDACNGRLLNNAIHSSSVVCKCDINSLHIFQMTVLIMCFIF